MSENDDRPNAAYVNWILTCRNCDTEYTEQILSKVGERERPITVPGKCSECDTELDTLGVTHVISYEIDGVVLSEEAAEA